MTSILLKILVGYIFLLHGLTDVASKSIELYADNTDACTGSLHLDTESAVIRGRTPNVTSSTGKYAISSCNIRLRTKHKRAFYRVHIKTSVIQAAKLYVAVYDSAGRSAGLLDFLRQNVQAPQQKFETKGNTFKMEVNSNNPAQALNPLPYAFEIIVSETTSLGSCSGFNCYNQSVCVPWSVCHNDVDNCFDNSDETALCEGAPSVSAAMVVGIVFGVIAFIGAGVGFFFLVRHCYMKKQHMREMESFDNVGYRRETTARTEDPTDVEIHEGLETTDLGFGTANGAAEPSYIAPEYDPPDRDQSSFQQQMVPGYEGDYEEGDDDDDDDEDYDEDYDEGEDVQHTGNYHTTNFSHRESLAADRDPGDRIDPAPMTMID